MMRFIVVAVAVLGACSTMDSGDDSKESVGAAVDPGESAAAPTQSDVSALRLEPTRNVLACDGTPGQWAGCRGNGCFVCSELLSDAPCYLFNHPSCTRNTTCAGLHFTCNAACPTPSGPDLTCSTCNGTAGQWAGCRGNGCAVCAELVSGAPCYFRNHPKCNLNTGCGGLHFTCNAACPAPTSADINCT